MGTSMAFLQNHGHHLCHNRLDFRLISTALPLYDLAYADPVADTFLYSFIVPILGYMLQERLLVDIAHVQFYISAVLAVYGLVCMITGPIVGHFSDKSSNRKSPMLLALAGSMVGTFLLASARSVPVLFLGRALQAVNGSVSWVVGMATIADRVGEEDIGKVMGIVMSLQTAGPILGPMVSGILFDGVGYWLTWTVPLVILLLDFIARFLMVEVRPKSPLTPSSVEAAGSSMEDETETSALISGTDTQYQSIENIHAEDRTDPTSPFAFYLNILNDGRVLTALVISTVSMLFITSLDTTLPLHVQDVFNWGPSTSGLIFFSFSVSSLALTPLSGLLYDRIGPKYPLTICLIVRMLFAWLLGVPGSEQFPWTDSMTSGPAIFVTAIIGVGGSSPFLGGIGMLGLTSEFLCPLNRSFEIAAHLAQVLSKNARRKIQTYSDRMVVSLALMPLMRFSRRVP